MSTSDKYPYGPLTFVLRKRPMIAKGKATERRPRKATGLNARLRRMAAGLPVEDRHSALSRIAASPLL